MTVLGVSNAAWSRAAAVIFGGYAATMASSALMAQMLAISGAMTLGQGVLIAVQFSFFVYAGAAIWGFAERRVWRVWAVFAAVSLLGFGIVAVLKLAGKAA